MFRYFLLAVILLKLVCMGLFSSDYERLLFMPFVDSFLADISQNIYENFYHGHEVVAFPYPPGMLAIVSLGAILKGWANSPFLAQLLFKLPLLLFDLLGLYFLLQLYPARRKYIGILYFASPIILYAVYMHGQLDIIPTALILGAIVYIFRPGVKNEIIFALLLTLSLITKLHILAVIPLIGIYLLKQRDYRRLLIMLGMIVSVGSIVILPFCSSDIFWQSIFFNKEQSLLTKVYISFVDMKLYLPILALLIVYLQAYMLRVINRDLLISLCGLLFSVFLALLPPMPGWYVWIVPFITSFFINVADNKYKNIYLYLALNVLYIVYFLTAHASSYVDLYLGNMDLSFLKIDNAIYQNTIFTLLAGMLIYIIYELYIYGVASNLFYRRRGEPFTIGIAGDSGAGKSTLLSILERSLGKNDILLIEGDGDHKWERKAKMWDFYTQLNPKANFLYRQAKDIALLKRGTVVRRVEYDHATGKFTKEHRVAPKKYIMLSGLHAFYLPQMRRVLDLKIYMDTDESLRRFWKIKRDTTVRGYTMPKILEQIAARLADTEKYIVPQKPFADLIVSYFDDTLKDYKDMAHEVVLSLKFTLSSAINIENIDDILGAYGVKISYDFAPTLDKQTVIFSGEALASANLDFSKIMPQAIPHLEELTGADFKNLAAYEGIMELMLLLVISHKMKM